MTDSLTDMSRAERRAGARHARHVLAGTTPSDKEAKRAALEDEAEFRARLAREFDAIAAGTRADMEAREGRAAAARLLVTRDMARGQ